MDSERTNIQWHSQKIQRDHSLLLLVSLVFIAAIVVWSQDTAWPIALAVGALSHTVVDVLLALVRGEFAYTTFIGLAIAAPLLYDEQGRPILG